MTITERATNFVALQIWMNWDGDDMPPSQPERVRMARERINAMTNMELLELLDSIRVDT